MFIDSTSLYKSPTQHCRKHERDGYIYPEATYSRNDRAWDVWTSAFLFTILPVMHAAFGQVDSTWYTISIIFIHTLKTHHYIHELVGVGCLREVGNYILFGFNLVCVSLQQLFSLF